jgi:hypothetical protein
MGREYHGCPLRGLPEQAQAYPMNAFRLSLAGAVLLLAAPAAR